MRELLRSIAKASMKRRGVTRINKQQVRYSNGKLVRLPSYFAQNWRKEAAFALNAEYRENLFKSRNKIRKRRAYL